MTQQSATRSATAQHSAAGPGGTAARSGGLPGGDAAGTESGDDRASAHPQAQPLPGAGNRVLLIVLPGVDGAVAAPTGQGAPGQQTEGDGGTAAGSATTTSPGYDAEYVPPDQNEVPFPDQGLLGRYF